MYQIEVFKLGSNKTKHLLNNPTKDIAKATTILNTYIDNNNGTDVIKNPSRYHNTKLPIIDGKILSYCYTTRSGKYFIYIVRNY